MKLQGWDESLATGNSRIDEQHQFLFGLVAEMSLLREEPREHSYVPLLVTTVASYAAVHFQEEEEIMEQSGFPLREAHQVEHQALTGWLAGFPSEYEAGRASLKDVVSHMQSWIETHIRQSDTLWVEHLKSLKA